MSLASQITLLATRIGQEVKKKVQGPTSVNDKTLAAFDGATGKIIREVYGIKMNEFGDLEFGSGSQIFFMSNGDGLYFGPGEANISAPSTNALRINSKGATIIDTWAETGPYLQINGTDVKVVNRTDVAKIPLVVQGMAAQTGNLQEWRDSTGAILARVTAAGLFISARGTSRYEQSEMLTDIGP